MSLPEWLPRTIIVPANEAERDAVRLVQRVLRVEPTGEMDAATASSLRGFQRLMKLRLTGFIDEETANVIDKMRWV